MSRSSGTKIALMTSPSHVSTRRKPSLRCANTSPTWLRKKKSSSVYLECISGYHRASTTGATVAEMLNARVDECGNRMYNVQIFSLLEYTKPRSMANQVDQAIVWATQTDCKYLMPGGPDVPNENHFGFKACMQREAARHAFASIWDWVDNRNAPYFDTLQAVTDDVLEQAPRTPSEPPTVPPPPPPPSTNVVPPPWKRAKTSAGSNFDMSNSPRGDFVAQPWMAVGDVDLGLTWAEEMHNQGVDFSAQKSLFALSQEGPFGRAAACGIMTKIFKKESNHGQNYNPSAYIHSCTTKAWNKIGCGTNDS